MGNGWPELEDGQLLDCTGVHTGRVIAFAAPYDYTDPTAPEPPATLYNLGLLNDFSLPKKAGVTKLEIRAMPINGVICTKESGGWEEVSITFASYHAAVEAFGRAMRGGAAGILPTDFNSVAGVSDAKWWLQVVELVDDAAFDPSAIDEDDIIRVLSFKNCVPDSSTWSNSASTDTQKTPSVTARAYVYVDSEDTTHSGTFYASFAPASGTYDLTSATLTAFAPGT